MDKQAIEKIKDSIFNDKHQLYGIVDGAACPELRFKIYELEPISACLWSGALEPDMQEVAPYMVLLERESAFTDWLIGEGWGKHWGIFITSELDFKGFRKQVRKLLLVKSPEGDNMIFRFYDPRVLDGILPTLEKDQLEEFFSRIESIYYRNSSTSLLMAATFKEELTQTSLV